MWCHFLLDNKKKDNFDVGAEEIEDIEDIEGKHNGQTRITLH